MRAAAVAGGIAGAIGLLIVSPYLVRALAETVGVPPEAQAVIASWIRLLGSIALLLLVHYACRVWDSVQRVSVMLFEACYWVAVIAVAVTMATDNWQVLPGVGTALWTAVVVGVAAYLGYVFVVRFICLTVLAERVYW